MSPTRWVSISMCVCLFVTAPDAVSGANKAEPFVPGSVKQIAVLPLTGLDPDAACVIHAKLIESLAERCRIPVLPLDQTLAAAGTVSRPKNAITSREAQKIAESLHVDAVIFGNVVDFLLSETESDIIGDKKRKELTSTMKFTLEWQIVTTADGKVSELDRIKVSEHDTRTNIYKSDLSQGDREKYPAATMQLFERSAKSLGKKILKALDLSR